MSTCQSVSPAAITLKRTIAVTASSLSRLPGGVNISRSTAAPRTRTVWPWAMPTIASSSG
eukprot:2187245-Alexandrium_andersonii.AAC.1